MTPPSELALIGQSEQLGAYLDSRKMTVTRQDHLDPDLLGLFLQLSAWKYYAEQCLSSDPLDEQESISFSTCDGPPEKRKTPVSLLLTGDVSSPESADT